VHESWKEERKIWSGIPFSKTFKSVKPCLLFSFLFFPMIPTEQVSWKEERKKMPGHSIFSKPFQYGKPCLIFNFLFSP
jgi:hypothetical protein